MIKYRITSIAFFILIWSLFARYYFSESGLMPSPYGTATALVNLFLTGNIFQHIASSFYRVSVGFGYAALIALILSYLGFYYRWLNELLSPLIGIFRSIPPVSFIPLAILWFGLGDPSAIFLVSFAAFFPVFTSNTLALETVDTEHRDTALTMGASSLQLLTKIYLPASLPILLDGIKTSLSISWFVLIVAEMVGAQSGLGYFIQLNRLTLQSQNVVAGMVVIGVSGYITVLLVDFFKRRLHIHARV